jgi:hypothetical protein
MQPDLHLSYLAILAAIAAKAVLGALWYGPLFGRAWNRELGGAPGYHPTGAVLLRARVLRAIGMALTAYALAVAVAVIRPSSWGAGSDGPDGMYGFLAALGVWIGFYVPQLLSRVAWEGASWRLLRVHLLYHFVALQLAAQILARWG